MAKHDAYIALLNEFKTVSPTISHEQRIGLIRRGVEEHGFSVVEAVEILNTSGLIIGEQINYFEVLGLSGTELDSRDESDIASNIDNAHTKRYRESLNAGGRIRPDGKTEEQWREVLNQARDILKDRKRREEHIAILLNEVSEQHSQGDETPVQELPDEIPEDDSTSLQQATDQTIPLNIDVPDGMVYIPDGEFQMGSDQQVAKKSEKPVHNVYTDAFFMDKYLVTNAQFKEFVDANPEWRKPQPSKTHIDSAYHDGAYLEHWHEDNYPNDKDNHPITKVSWYAAMAYALWKGKRLPTEAEWEKAARGDLQGMAYPWGDSIDATHANYLFHIGHTTHVGQYPPNRYGLYDMCGNAWEWCLDGYQARFYVKSPLRNPFSDKQGKKWFINYFKIVKTPRVLRGGAWGIDPQSVRVSFRFKSPPEYTLQTFGFRCVMDLTS